MDLPLTFLHCRRYPGCTATVNKRFTYYTLQMMTAGAVELFYDDVRYEMHHGWFWPCHPGPVIRFHAWPREGKWDHRYVAFTGPMALRWQSEGLLMTEPEAIVPSDMRQMTKLFDALLVQAERPGRWARLRAINLLEQLLLERAELRQGPSPQGLTWLKQIMSALATVGPDLNYKALARSQGMSLTTLRRKFRAATGMTMHEHHLACRMTEARRLLGETDLPIKVVADELGYRDLYYFNRQFHQQVGVPRGHIASHVCGRESLGLMQSSQSSQWASGGILSGSRRILQR
ncbi:MAG: AraC family transcriptional regulator [Phycisphaerales bacterium]|nr:AraC family transcriptional regulator [Phycisphaerales bacterium]